MLQTIVLICAAAIDPAACTPANAIDVMRFPARPGILCGRDDQATLARMAIGPEPGRSYPKTICTRVR